jgi:tetraacyldisaccharide 4'-kinase
VNDLRGARGIVRTTLGAAIGSALARGLPPSKVATWVAAPWASRASVVRDVALPPGKIVIGVSGPTLGGSYKTPFTAAFAEALSRHGRAVAVVSHGYGARALGTPRAVAMTDDVRAVGDDALAVARALVPHSVPVVVGARREDSLAFAASLGDVIVVDGLLQTTPERLALSILVTDATRPFGAGLCPPAGDLRAPEETLRAAADLVVSVSDDGESGPERGDTLAATFSIEGARRASGETVSLASLSDRPVGVVLTVARPERVLRALGRAGILPVETRLFRDHATPRALRPRGGGPEVWLTTEKCATKLGTTYDGAAVLVLQGRLSPPEAIVRRALSLRASLTHPTPQHRPRF